MRRAPDDERITEQAAMCALGMLNQSEARAFNRRLAEGVEGYAEELRAFDAVVAEMALRVEELTPPGGLRERLLARISDEANQKAPIDSSS